MANREPAGSNNAEIATLPDYARGVAAFRNGEIDVLFGDLSLVLGTVEGDIDELLMLDRLFTRERAALALARNDDDFCLLVGRTLSGLYVSGEFMAFDASWIGKRGAKVDIFVQWNTLPV